MKVKVIPNCRPCVRRSAEVDDLDDELLIYCCEAIGSQPARLYFDGIDVTGRVFAARRTLGRRRGAQSHRDGYSNNDKASGRAIVECGVRREVAGSVQAHVF